MKTGHGVVGSSEQITHFYHRAEPIMSKLKVPGKHFISASMPHSDHSFCELINELLLQANSEQSKVETFPTIVVKPADPLQNFNNPGVNQ